MEERADHAWFTAVHCFSRQPGAWILGRWVLTHVECADGVRKISEQRLVQATGWTESVIRRILGEWQLMGMVELPGRGRKRVRGKSDQVWELSTVGFAETLCRRLTRVATSIRAQSEFECGCDVCDLGHHMPDEANSLVCTRCGDEVRTVCTVSEDEWNSLPLVQAMQMYHGWSPYSGCKLPLAPQVPLAQPSLAALQPTMLVESPEDGEDWDEEDRDEDDWEDVALDEQIMVDGVLKCLAEVTEEDQLKMSTEEYHRFYSLMHDKNTAY